MQGALADTPQRRIMLQCTCCNVFSIDILVSDQERTAVEALCSMEEGKVSRVAVAAYRVTRLGCAVPLPTPRLFDVCCYFDFFQTYPPPRSIA